MEGIILIMTKVIKHLIEFIKNSEKSFKLTYWDGHTSLSDINELYNITLASLVRDFKLNKPNPIKIGTHVELSLVIKDVPKTGRYIYKGIESNNNGFSQIKLEPLSQKGTIYFLNQDNAFWRLKPTKTNSDVAKRYRLSQREISEFNRGISSAVDEDEHKIFITDIKTLSDGQLNERNLYNFKRTKILLLTRKYNRDFNGNIEAKIRFAKILRIFSAGIFTAANIKDLNEVPFMKTQRGFENDIIVFTYVEHILEFINKYHSEEFLIVTDKFNQIYHEDFYQSFVDFFNKESNNDRVSLLVLPKVKHLIKLADGHNDILLNNNIITPIILKQTTINSKDLEEAHQSFMYDGLDDNINQLDLEIKKWKFDYAPYAEKLSKIKWSCFALLNENTSVHTAIIKYRNEFKEEPNITTIIDSLVSAIIDKGYKIKTINELMKDETNLLYANSMIDADILENFQGRFFSRSDFDPDKLCKNNLLLYFVDKWFIRDQLIPAIIFGKIKVSQLRFILYQSEMKFIKSIFYTTLNRIEPLFKNGEVVMKYATKKDVLDNYFDVSTEEFFNFEIELNPIISSAYINEASNSDTDDVVKIKTYFFAKYLENKYLAYLSDNYKPLILNNEELKKCDLSRCKKGDVFLFFGDEGVTDILANYPEFYYSNIQEERTFNEYMSQKDKWRDALIRSKREYGYVELLTRLIDSGLSVDELKLKRWIEDDSLIAPHNPRVVIEKIGMATDDDDLLKNHKKVSEACVYLQSRARTIGKIIRKLAIRELNDIENEVFYKNLTPAGKEKILSMAEKIKLLNMIDFDETTHFVRRADSNKLISYD